MPPAQAQQEDQSHGNKDHNLANARIRSNSLTNNNTKMNFRQIALLAALASSANAFAPQPSQSRSSALSIATGEISAENIMKDVRYSRVVSL